MIIYQGLSVLYIYIYGLWFIIIHKIFLGIRKQGNLQIR